MAATTPTDRGTGVLLFCGAGALDGSIRPGCFEAAPEPGEQGWIALHRRQPCRRCAAQAPAAADGIRGLTR